jgi:hypothetical protein
VKRDNQGRTLAKWRKAVREACSEARNKSYAVLPLLPEKYQEARIYYSLFGRLGRYHGFYYLRLDGSGTIEELRGLRSNGTIEQVLRRYSPVFAASEEAFLMALMAWCSRSGISIPAMPAKRRGNNG